MNDENFVAEAFVIPHVYGSDENPAGPAFAGFWTGERAGGWAVAYFTKEEGLRIVASSVAVMAAVPFYRGRYAEDRDAFIFDDGVHPLEVYPGEDYLVNGSPTRLYNIGGRGRWIWQTAAAFGVQP